MTRPYDNAHAYDVIVLGTVESPGVVTLSRHDRPKRWNVKSAKGRTGASMTLNGDDPADFDASFYLADDRDTTATGESQFDQWDVFQKIIESLTNSPKPFAVPIYHPDLARNRITEVTNAGVGGMVHDGKGGANVKVTFKEYKPPKKKAAASPGAKAAATAAKPDPNAAAKAELASLLAEVNKP